MSLINTFLLIDIDHLSLFQLFTLESFSVAKTINSYHREGKSKSDIVSDICSGFFLETQTRKGGFVP